MRTADGRGTRGGDKSGRVDEITVGLAVIVFNGLPVRASKAVRNLRTPARMYH